MPLTPEGWTVTGTLFDGLTSRPYPATLWLEAGRWHLHTQERQWELLPAQVQLEPPLTGLSRALLLRGCVAGEPLGSGARLECLPEQVALLERQLPPSAGMRFVTALERHWGGALVALLCVAAFGYAFVNVVLPFAAREAAQATSITALKKLDEETVRYLQKSDMVSDTHLSKARQQQLTKGFAALTRERGGQYPYHLLFRHGGEGMGANAFALPAGTIVITDELVTLAHSDREIYGVLAHELSHVTHRDALTQMYQALGLTLLAGAVTGDLVGPSTTAAAIPSFLLQSRYSRQMEAVADHAAGEYLLQHDGTTRPLQDMLRRLESSAQNSNKDKQSEKSKKSPKEAPKDNKGEAHKYDWIESWLGDHPLTAARIAALQQQEHEWKLAGH